MEVVPVGKSDVRIKFMAVPVPGSTDFTFQVFRAPVGSVDPTQQSAVGLPVREANLTQPTTISVDDLHPGANWDYYVQITNNATQRRTVSARMAPNPPFVPPVAPAPGPGAAPAPGAAAPAPAPAPARLSGGAIAGIVIASVVVVTAVGLGLGLGLRRRRRVAA